MELIDLTQVPATPAQRRWQATIGAGLLALAVLMAWGASAISGEAGYAGVGPNFLPWLVTAALALCGALLLAQALRGGFTHMEPAPGAEQGHWVALAWVVGGVLANAALITRIGFIAACTLCFALAARGLRLAEGQGATGWRSAMQDLLTGALIAAPTYWVFTKVLGINLPGLTGTGWL